MSDEVRGIAEKQGGLETRNRILKAAEECFARYGYDSTGVAEICKAAAISKGALYHHFPSKQAIFVEMFENWMNGFAGQMERIRDSAASVPDALLKMVRMTGLIFQKAAGQLPLFIEFLTKASREPETWKATIAPYKFFRDFFSGLIRRGIEEGTIRKVDPELTARIIVSFGAGLVMQGVFDPEGGHWVQVGVQGINTLLKGMIEEGTE
ncbi:MAG: TetR/AcrR family transcriptional regulator [Spirochaetaceae bacterium]|nr:MAG: TetR/AcrR family transcriptional regulator [Spirochaetaceae bacterium]